MSSQDKTPYTVEEVRARLEQELERNNVVFHNKAAIAKELGCSPTTIFRWLSGALPKDPGLMHQFCKKYGVDMVYWTSGERSDGGPVDKLDLERLSEALETVNAFESTGNTLSAKKRTHLVALMYAETGASRAIAETLTVVSAANKDGT
jgi:transcriptional regulator with XRE-family HTH domain